MLLLLVSVPRGNEMDTSFINKRKAKSKQDCQLLTMQKLLNGQDGCCLEEAVALSFLHPCAALKYQEPEAGP